MDNSYEILLFLSNDGFFFSSILFSKLWNAINGEEMQTFPHKHIVRACDFGIEDKIVTGGLEKILRIFDIERPHRKRTIS